MNKECELVKQWDGSPYVECFWCQDKVAEAPNTPFCSQECFDKFDDKAPIAVIHELYEKLKEAKKRHDWI